MRRRQVPGTLAEIVAERATAALALRGFTIDRHPLDPLDALFLIDRSALKRSRSQPRIGSDLTAVVKVGEEALAPQDSGEFGSDPLEP